MFILAIKVTPGQLFAWFVIVNKRDLGSPQVSHL